MIRRKGSTLIELALSMSAGSAVMLLAISLVHQTMMLTEESRHRTDNNRTLDQLAQHFRRDVHLATEIRVSSDHTLILKLSDDSQVTYLAQGLYVIREPKNTSVKYAKERFQLSDASLATFQGLQSPNRVSLTIQRETGLQGIPARIDLRVEAMVGRWRTLEHVGKESK